MATGRKLGAAVKLINLISNHHPPIRTQTKHPKKKIHGSSPIRHEKRNYTPILELWFEKTLSNPLKHMKLHRTKSHKKITQLLNPEREEYTIYLTPFLLNPGHSRTLQTSTPHNSWKDSYRQTKPRREPSKEGGGHSGHRFWAQLLTSNSCTTNCFLLIQNLQKHQTEIESKWHVCCAYATREKHSQPKVRLNSPQPKTMKLMMPPRKLSPRLCSTQLPAIDCYSPNEEIWCSIVNVSNLSYKLKMSRAQDRWEWREGGSFKGREEANVTKSSIWVLRYWWGPKWTLLRNFCYFRKIIGVAWIFFFFFFFITQRLANLYRVCKQNFRNKQLGYGLASKWAESIDSNTNRYCTLLKKTVEPWGFCLSLWKTAIVVVYFAHASL